MTQIEFGELVNTQLCRLELEPFFLLETQYNSRDKNISYCCYYYPDENNDKLKSLQPQCFRSRGYKTTNELLTALSKGIDNFLAGIKEDITID